MIPKINDIPAKKKNGNIKPPMPKRNEPTIGPTKNPKDVETSAIAIFYSTVSGYRRGM